MEAKSNNFARTTIVSAVAFVVGCAAMYFFNPQPDCPDCSECPPPPHATFQPIEVKEAHNLSAQYRKSSNLCNPITPADTNYTGIYQLSIENLNEILAAAQQIETDEGVPVPFYRIYMGMNGPTGQESYKLIVVGVNDANIEYSNYIKYFDFSTAAGYLPCPKFCEISKSQLFNFQPNNPRGGSCVLAP